jgi:hypothetical protein
MYACNLLERLCSGQISLDFERACREWAKCCVSRGVQIDLLVAHHAQIFE